MGNQPILHEYARRAIAARQWPARSRTEVRAHGKSVVRKLWAHALAPGEVDFPGARLLLLVRQQHCDDEDNLLKEDYRYVVTSDDRRDRSHRLRACRPFLRCWPPQSPQCTAPRLNGGAWPHRASLS